MKNNKFITLETRWSIDLKLKEAFFFKPKHRPRFHFGPVGHCSSTTCRECMIWCAFDSPTLVDDSTYPERCSMMSQAHSIVPQSGVVSKFWSHLIPNSRCQNTTISASQSLSSNEVTKFILLSFRCCRVCSSCHIKILFTSIDHSDSEEAWKHKTSAIEISETSSGGSKAYQLIWLKIYKIETLRSRNCSILASWIWN